MPNLQSINPVNNLIISEYSVLSESEIQKVLSQTEQTFQEYRHFSFQEKSALLLKVSEILLSREAEIALIITREMGKILSESLAEVRKCAACCSYYAEHGPKYLADEIIGDPSSRNRVVFQPLGAILAIMPWNFPLWQVFRFAAPALMAGNVGVLKHASNVQGCAQIMEDVFKEAGFPVGCFTNLPITSAQVARVIANPIIKAVTLTGSEKAGISVATEAGKNLKKTVLELGGSDAFIVLDDVEIEQIAKKAVAARMINNGQSCIAAKRFIVLEKVAEEFKAAFAKNLDTFVMGNPEQEGINYGPMARPDLAKELENQVKRCLDLGAQVLTSKVPVADGAWFPATLLGNINPSMPAWKEEFFGPVAILLVAADDADAIRIANDTAFGLGASVWSNDVKRAENIALKLESGCAFVNDTVKSDPAFPFGGIKKSGYGRELGYFGIREFVNIKTLRFG